MRSIRVTGQRRKDIDATGWRDAVLLLAAQLAAEHADGQGQDEAQLADLLEADGIRSGEYVDGRGLQPPHRGQEDARAARPEGGDLGGEPETEAA